LVPRVFNEGERTSNRLFLHAVAANIAFGVCKAAEKSKLASVSARTAVFVRPPRS
jgi:hypothetical protein